MTEFSENSSVLQLETKLMRVRLNHNSEVVDCKAKTKSTKMLRAGTFCREIILCGSLQLTYHKILITAGLKDCFSSLTRLRLKVTSKAVFTALLDADS